ncbi:MAG: TlyA family RNA methyltransferase, partial [Thiovulaceae bacterium]|nr:TlyA family RNA methyltransferase [Sulfurimonadaceae bacterium]
IQVDGTVLKKPAAKVDATNQIKRLIDKVYVGRAALKLKAFLAHHKVEIKDKKALDIGASTGGFTEILLEEGASEVVAVDVGRDQLHPRIKANEKVISIEEQDIRTFQSPAFELVTCDVSFISIHNILEAIDRLSSDTIIILFKPQFEVGNVVKRNRAGVVTDEKAIQSAKQKFEDVTKSLGWKLIVSTPSQLEGKEGNIEQFYQFRKDS